MSMSIGCLKSLWIWVQSGNSMNVFGVWVQGVTFLSHLEVCVECEYSTLFGDFSRGSEVFKPFGVCVQNVWSRSYLGSVSQGVKSLSYVENMCPDWTRVGSLWAFWRSVYEGPELFLGNLVQYVTSLNRNVLRLQGLWAGLGPVF